jgi:hypothetical protein
LIIRSSFGLPAVRAPSPRAHPLLLAAVAPKFQKNFGFMYSYVGRSLFIFFAATMTYALYNWLSWITGTLTIINGIFNLSKYYVKNKV